MSAPAAERAIRPGLLLTLLLAVVAAVYAPALGADYVFDDRLIVITSPMVEELRPLAEYFSRPFFTSAAGEVPGYYRPLVVLSFALDYRLHDAAAGGLHLTNLALHLINTALFVYWLRRRGSSAVSALALAALWALHPRLTEAATWISGRTDVMATTCVLAALCVWRPSAKGRIASALLLWAGLLAKETALAGLAALFCNEWAEARHEPRALQRAAKRSLPSFAVFALYLAMRLFTVGLGEGHQPLGPWLRLLGFIEAVGRYAFDLALPWLPNAVQGRLGRPTLAFAVIGALALLALIGVAWAQRHRLRAEHAAPAALLVVSLGLALHVVPIPSRMVSADRFLYLPLIGLLAWAAPALERLWRSRALARLSTLALLLSFGVFSFRRSSLWADETAFWVDQYRRANDVERYVPSTELAAVFWRVGLYEPALELSRRGIATGDPSLSSARYNAALSLARLGRTSEARQLLDQLSARNPRHSRYLLDLALLDLQEYRFTQARQRLTNSLGSAPELRKAGELLARVGELEAIHRRLQADPTFALSHEGLLQRAELASGVARVDEAVRLWAEVAGNSHSREQTRTAVARLMRMHDLGAMRTALGLAQARFGAMPDLESALDVRRADIEAALAAARALGL